MNKFLQYQVFIAVVEEGSLSAAARSLNVTPSAISKQLTALETSLGSQLIERTNKSTQPTKAGKTFYEQCKKILISITDAENTITAKDQAPTGTINVTLSKSLIRSDIFEGLSDFQKLYPQVKYNLVFSDQVLDLYEDEFDFAFRLGDLGDSSRIYSKFLVDTNLICCATPEYLQQNEEIKSINDLTMKSVILPEAKNLSTELRKFFKKSHLKVSYENWHNTNDIEAIYHAINNGFAAGFLLDISITKELNENKFLNILPNTKLPSKKLHLLYKRQTHTTTSIDLFKSFFINRFKHL